MLILSASFKSAKLECEAASAPSEDRVIAAAGIVTMNPSDLESFERSYAELLNRFFEFCTRCGTRVRPYSSNDYLDHDEAWNYSESLLGDANVPEAQTEYWCPQCETRWRAFAKNDTAWIRPCGHLMPFYVSFCAICGVR
jgi:DNA-directed RNA polymerase subunit RPC12/RpoP